MFFNVLQRNLKICYITPELLMKFIPCIFIQLEDL